MGRFVLARTVGLRRGQPVELDLPAITAPGDLGRAGAVCSAIPTCSRESSRILEPHPIHARWLPIPHGSPQAVANIVCTMLKTPQEARAGSSRAFGASLSDESLLFSTQASGICLELPIYCIGVQSRRDLKLGGFEIYTPIEIPDLLVNFFQTPSLFLVALLFFVQTNKHVTLRFICSVSAFLEGAILFLDLFQRICGL